MALALAFWYAESEKGISLLPCVKARTTVADEHNASSSSRNLMVGYGVGVGGRYLDSDSILGCSSNLSLRRAYLSTSSYADFALHRQTIASAKTAIDL